jgi:Protein of unknown function (DUF4242)
LALYLVDRDLPRVTVDQLAAAQRAAIATSREFTAGGQPVRYIRSTFLPLEAHCLCLFEAANASLVKAVNEAAQIPFTRVSEAFELEPASSD